jgi:aryl-alcohol dehydrogenase-like predicted oxidoreductase
MEKRTLGQGKLQVSALGLGCMGMSFAYSGGNDAESLRVLHRYFELGGTFLDTAELYGPYTNEELIGRFLKEVPRDQLVVATKFGFRIDPLKGTSVGVDSSPENIRRACEASLKRLGLETIDLYYQHRVDPSITIEEVMGVLADLVTEGKIRAIGLSEASSETIRRATSVYPVTAVQSEYSLWTREVETDGVLETCRDLGIGFVPYSPLGRGFLTGTIQKPTDLAEDDWRRTNPRFEEQALEKNLQLANHVKDLANRKGCTPAQLALAWVLAQGEHIVPIPGTKRIKYLEENIGALNVSLTQTELEEIDRLIPVGITEGERYSPAAMKFMNG